MLKFCLIFILSIFLPNAVYSAKPKSNYDLIIDKFEVTDQDPELTKFEGSVKEVNGKNAISVNFTMFKDAPPTDVHINLFAFYNNKYNPIPINIKKNVCDALEEEFKLIEEQLEGSKIPKKCPVLKGEYSIINFSPNIDSLPIPATIPWNKVKVTVKLISDKGKLLANFDVYARLEKKKAKKIGK